MNKKELEELFRTHRTSVFQRARSLLRDPDAAEDVTSDVFFRMMRRPGEIEELESPMAWLHRVTTNLCLKRRRDSARRRRILEAHAAPSPSPAPRDAPVDVSLTVRRILETMPKETQSLAISYYIDRMSQEEIASDVGMPRRTVSLRLERFRREAYGRHFGSPASSSRPGRLS